MEKEKKEKKLITWQLNVIRHQIKKEDKKINKKQKRTDFVKKGKKNIYIHTRDKNLKCDQTF